MLRLFLITFVLCLVSIPAIGNEMYQDLTKQMDTINFEKTIEYEVTEIIQKTFGSSKISYTASNKSEIRTNDLGPNNKRIIKEKIVYRKRQPDLEQPQTSAKHKVLDSLKSQKLETKAIQSIALNNDIVYDSLKISNHQTESKSITIKPLETYERMVEDGFQTAEILDILANQNFYNKKYKKAAKYFEILFTLTDVVNEENTMKYQECLRNIKVEAQLAKNHTRNRISSKKRQ